MWTSGKCKTNKETRENFFTSVIGRFPEGGWVYMGFKSPKWKIMHQEFFRNTMLEARTKSRLDKLIGWGTNAYICPQVFFHGSRSSENLYALQNMVIDIDMHSERYCTSLRDQKINSLAHILLHDADDYGLPEPNWVVFTGRGLQIWWRHESMAANKCLNTWTSILRCFIEILKQIIADHLEGDPEDTLGGLAVDEQASLNPVGFFRIPGTYNPSSKTYAFVADGVAPEYIYSYKELVRFRNTYRADCPITPKKPAMKTKYQVPGYKWDVSAWAESTALKIETLRDMRNEDLGNENRNNFCLALYSLYRSAGMDESAAMERLNSFNSGFKRPMRTTDLKSTLASAHKKLYQYSTSALVNLLNISEKEAAAIGLKYSVEKPKLNRKQEIQERNQKIISLYQTTDMTQEEVGNAVGVSRKTVGDVLRGAGINRAIRNADKIRSLSKKGNSIEQISEKIGCSDRTVYRVLQNTAGKNAGGAPKAAQTSSTTIYEETSVIFVDEPTVTSISAETLNPPFESVCAGECGEGESMGISVERNTAADLSGGTAQSVINMSAFDRMYLPSYNNGCHIPKGERSGLSGPFFESASETVPGGVVWVLLRPRVILLSVWGNRGIFAVNL